MPEFILDMGSPEHARAFNALDSFTQGYITAMFFTDEERLCDESDDFEMPSVAINTATMESRFVGGNSPGFGDLHPDALAKIVSDCATFQERHAALLDAATELEPGSRDYRYGRDCLDYERLGQLFWYARNGHGVTFTDDGDAACLQQLQDAARKWSTVDSYIGDDGKVHLA